MTEKKKTEKQEKQTPPSPQAVSEKDKLLKQKSTPKKIAKIFALIWIVCLICPVMYLLYAYTGAVKEFMVVKGLAEVNNTLTTQYEQFTDSLLSGINLKGLSDKIKIPELKTDSLEKSLQQIEAASALLKKTKLVKTDQLDNTVKEIEGKINQLNAQMKQTVEEVQKTVQKQLQADLKKQISSFAGTQVQKQLGLSDTAYTVLRKESFGLFSAEGRKASSSVYAELVKNKDGFLSGSLKIVDRYFVWVICVIAVLALVILLIPVFLVFWVAKKLSATFAECPYCGKVFLSKQGKLSILKVLKK